MVLKSLKSKRGLEFLCVASSGQQRRLHICEYSPAEHAAWARLPPVYIVKLEIAVAIFHPCVAATPPVTFLFGNLSYLTVA